MGSCPRKRGMEARDFSRVRLHVGKITARYEDGMSIEQIAEKTNVSVQVVKNVLKEAGMI